MHFEHQISQLQSNVDSALVAAPVLWDQFHLMQVKLFLDLRAVASNHMPPCPLSLLNLAEGGLLVGWVESVVNVSQHEREVLAALKEVVVRLLLRRNGLDFS